jgi:prophage regulatory protein
MPDINQDSLTILRRRQVSAKTGLSRSSIYAKIALGEFPKSIPLGQGAKTRAVGWVESSVNDWIKSQISAASQKVYADRTASRKALTESTANTAPVKKQAKARRRAPSNASVA